MLLQLDGHAATAGGRPQQAADILQLLVTEFAERRGPALRSLLIERAETEMPPGFGTFEPRRDVDPVGENIVVLNDDVALLDPDPDLDPPLPS